MCEAFIRRRYRMISSIVFVNAGRAKAARTWRYVGVAYNEARGDPLREKWVG
jgi:hypothetical protein